MPLALLLDWTYTTFVQGMDEKQRANFDAELDAIKNADEIYEQAKAQRRELARLNAQRSAG
jgi:hypothetical protein